MPHLPGLRVISWASLSIAALSAIVILFDVLRKPQRMMVMNVVWPITGLYGGPLAVWLYYRLAPAPRAGRQHRKEHMGSEPSAGEVGVAVSHCGAGCTLGDIVGETLLGRAGLAILDSPSASSPPIQRTSG